MSTFEFLLGKRLTASGLLARYRTRPVLVVAGLHAVALLIMAWTEVAAVPRLAFLLAWALLNCVWLLVLRRPAASAALSLVMLVALIVLSQFKHHTLLMTVNFVDLMVVDLDTFAFLLTVFPDLRWQLLVAALVAVPLLVVLWRMDPFRVRATVAAAGGTACLVGLTALSMAAPTEFYDEFFSHNYVSKFARTGVEAVSEFTARGFLESDATTAERLNAGADRACHPSGRPPHILMVFDESSFDITAAPGIKVPAGYRRHFRSADGKARQLMVEGVGGPSWLTEYNVLAGLSARSYGRFAEFVTRIAAGRVERGLPHALRKCGYKTFSLYPFHGAFLGARAFQTTTGIEHFIDSRALGTRKLQPDHFYFDHAARLIARELGQGPLFLFVYTAANHFPWNTAFRPDLSPGWRPLGNKPEIDEYIRRQGMSARDYTDFLARLEREFPGEPFLIVRFGDHQPEFGMHIVDPTVGEPEIARRIMANDPRYYATYYALEAINFRPKSLSSALDRLDAPYLPLVVLEAAGLPLDASFAEQKRILQRCGGVFYLCAQGREARRFNRLLIDAGLIKGL
jgi:hypothetical protein